MAAFCGGESGLSIPRRLLASTTVSWFGPDFLVLFHSVVLFYYLLSLFMSFFRTTIGVAYCSVLKGLSLLDDLIYLSCFLDGCNFSWILRSANLAVDYLVNLSKTRMSPLG